MACYRSVLVFYMKGSSMLSLLFWVCYIKKRSPQIVWFLWLERCHQPWQLIWLYIDSSKTHFYVDFKDVSHLETCMDYFALSGKSCKNMIFFACLLQITLASQFLWLSCFDRTTKIQIFTTSTRRCKIIHTHLNLRHLYQNFTHLLIW